MGVKLYVHSISILKVKIYKNFTLDIILGLVIHTQKYNSS